MSFHLNFVNQNLFKGLHQFIRLAGWKEFMVCGLSIAELEILSILYADRCLACNRSFNLKKISKKFRAKHGLDPNDVAKGLESKKYLGAVPKRDIKYFISDISRTCYAINHHGGNATEGRILPRRLFKLES